MSKRIRLLGLLFGLMLGVTALASAAPGPCPVRVCQICGCGPTCPLCPICCSAG